MTYRGHFYSLDVMRGLAALSVIFWHWQHFFFIGTTPPKWDMTQQPLFFLFRPLYLGGWRAVDLFFCLSGFIFFWLYSERITQRRISVKEFFILRFSRLYPLQFVTLLFVAGGQMLMLSRFGSYFVIPHNDLRHFILQLFFASSWGFQRGDSFNATTWSVSIEVMLYVLFFIVCFLRWNRWWHLVLYAWIGDFLLNWHLEAWSRGVLSFFIGGLTFRLFLLLWRLGLSRHLVLGLITMTTMLWMVIPVSFHDNGLFTIFESSPLKEHLLIWHKDVVGHYLLVLRTLSFDVILFPATILTLAICEAFRGTLGQRVAFMGNMSYSIYLIHFPLQLTFAFVAMSFSLPHSIFYSPWMLLGFVSVLIPLSLGSYSYFERPAQDYLRARFLKQRNPGGEKGAPASRK